MLTKNKERNLQLIIDSSQISVGVIVRKYVIEMRADCTLEIPPLFSQGLIQERD